jgi:membrane protease YdiL (CAAX protease family)
MKMQPWLQWLGRHFQGHVFLFEAKRPLPIYDSSAGLRLLLIFILLEGVIGPRLPLFRVFGLPLPPTWLRVPVLLVLAMVLVRFFAGVRLAQIGLFRWTDWSVTEKSYFVQVFLIANVVFGILFAERLQMILADLGFWWRPAAVVIFTNFLWGFHQELVYRGILQTELVRRWGSLVGILVSNLFFTFGPLHFYHFSGVPGRVFPMFTGIFLIGLFFGVLFRRSGNLAIVGVLHGLGNCYIDGLSTLGR